jgi:hypothetical protein
MHTSLSLFIKITQVIYTFLKTEFYKNIFLQCLSTTRVNFAKLIIPTKIIDKNTSGMKKSTKVTASGPKIRWIQDITDELQMSASDTGHLAYDRAVFRRVVKGTRGHATEGMTVSGR